MYHQQQHRDGAARKGNCYADEDDDSVAASGVISTGEINGSNAQHHIDNGSVRRNSDELHQEDAAWLRSKNASLLSSCCELEKRSMTMRQQLFDIKVTNEKHLMERRQQFETLAGRLKAGIDASERDMQVLKEKLEAQKQRTQAASQKYADAQKELVVQQEALGQAQGENRSRQEEIESIEGEHAVTLEKQKKVQEQIDELNNRRAQQKNDVKTLKEKAQHAVIEKDAVAALLADKHQGLVDMQEKINKLKEERLAAFGFK